MALCISTLASGGLIVNYRCTAACAHCLYACGPRREAQYLLPDVARTLLTRIRALGCRRIHIGGGEPFLDVQGLGRVLDVARDCGVGVEYVETNCFWARTTDQACAVLEELQAHGLGTILVSIDPFHNAAVPFRNVETAIAACGRVGMGVFPWQAEFEPDVRRFPTDATHGITEYIREFGADYPAQAFRRYGLTFGGRAARTFADSFLRKPVSHVLQSTLPCARLADTHHFHVDLHGGYVPGLCTGLSIAVADLGSPLERYPLLNLLYRGGVGALYAWACERHGFGADAGGYVNACHLCLEVRAHLAARAGAELPELAPAGFYSLLARERGALEPGLPAPPAGS